MQEHDANKIGEYSEIKLDLPIVESFTYRRSCDVDLTEHARGHVAKD